MADKGKTKAQLIQEIASLRRRIAQLEEVEKPTHYYDDLPIGINDVDIMGNFTYVNKRFLEVSGYSAEEIIGKNAFKLGIFPSTSLKLLAERMKDRLSGKPGRYLEVQVKCKDGRLIWVELIGTLLTKHRVPIGFQITSRDITQQKNGEIKLRESQKKFQALVETTNDFIWEMDVNGVYTYCSPQIEKLWGFKPGEM